MIIRIIKEELFKPHIVFLIISIVGGWLFLLINPPLWGLDEPAHFVRAYHISEGKLKPDTSSDNYGGSISNNFYAIAKYRDADILDGKFNEGYGVLHRHDVTDEHAYDKILSEKFSSSMQRFHWTAMYSPITYPGPVLGISIARMFDLNIGQTLFAARLFSLISYIILSFAALWIVRNLKLKWLFMIVALLPTALFQATIVTSDTLLLSLSLLFFAIFTRLLIGKNTELTKKWLTSVLVAVVIILPLIKINFLFLALSLLVLPASNFKSLKAANVFKAVSILFSVLIAILWSKLSGSANTPPLSQRPDQLPVNPSEQIAFVLTHPIEFIAALLKSVIIYGDSLFNGIFFTVSGNGVGLPILLTLLLMTSLLFTAVYARDELSKMKRQIWIFILASLVTSLSICGALYAVFNPVGWWFIDGLQGRYFTPFVLPSMMLLGLYVPISVTMKARSIKIMTFTCITIALVISIAYTYLAYY